MKTYLVGGAVRDILLGKTPKDRDYVIVGATAADLKKLKEEVFVKEENGVKISTQVGKNFPVFIHPETGDEYAIARTERKVTKGYHGFEFVFDENVTLEEDLMRRDLTINSIAQDLETGEIIDPFNGKGDLEAGILRATSEAFKEDPMRVLRAARFASELGFSLDEGLKRLMKELALCGELDTLGKESVVKELKKVFDTPKPSVFFYALKDAGCLGNLFPDLARLDKVPQNPIYHPEGDCFVHTMLVLDKGKELGATFLEMLTCLSHDFGKGITPEEILPKHIGHEMGGVPLVKEFAKEMLLSQKDTKFIVSFCMNHLRIHRCMEIKPSKILKLLKELGVIRRPELLESFLLCAKADDFGKLKDEYPQAEYLRGCNNFLSELKLEEKLEGVPSKQIPEKVHQFQVSALKHYLNLMKSQ